MAAKKTPAPKYTDLGVSNAPSAAERKIGSASNKQIKAKKEATQALKDYGLHDLGDEIDVADTRGNSHKAALDASKDARSIGWSGEVASFKPTKRSAVFKAARENIDIPEIPTLKPAQQQSLFTKQREFENSGGRDEKARKSIGTMMGRGSVDWSNNKHPITKLACQTPKCGNSVDVLNGGVVCPSCTSAGDPSGSKRPQ
jgi:hypothetical protein